MFYKAMAKKTFGAIVAAAMLAGSAGSLNVFADTYDYDNLFTFSDSAIEVSGTGSNYKVNGTALTINSAGTYVVTGDCSEGSIQVKKGTTGVTLVLSDLSLASSTTAPLSLNKTTETTVVIEGENTLTDNEYDETLEDYEGAGIKSKSGSTTTLTGTGTLTVDASSSNNGIKGASETNLIIGSSTTDSFTLNVTAANNGIASDGNLTINGGNLNVDAENDAIKSSPDEDDTESDGCITINGGSGTVKAGSDAVQAAQDLTVNGGDYTITTGSGYNDSSFNSDTMSCKGFKASAGSDESTDSSTETTETEESTDDSEATNVLTITGGSFTFNTADDAIHSDGSVVVTGGDFEIQTGDDAAHAETDITFGKENAADCSIHFKVPNCYEGIESNNVYIYSGCYDITASDDGINAADGSDSDDAFGPGGGQNGNGGQGGFGGNQGGFGPGQGGSNNQGGMNGPGNQGNQGNNNQPGQQNSYTSKFSINIYGGLININADGDGIDANGNLNMTGGTTIVWGGSGPENPLDYDGNFYINGATVFGAGYNQMAVSNPISGSQNYATFTSSITQGKTVNVKYNNSVEFSTKALKSGSYLFYSTPDMSSSSGYSISLDNSSVSGSNWVEHNWNNGEVTKAATTTEPGVITYTCTDCGATYSETTSKLESSNEESSSKAESSSSVESSSKSDSSSKSESSSKLDSSSKTDSSSVVDNSSKTESSSANDSTENQETVIAKKTISDFGWNNNNVIDFNLTGYDSAKIVAEGSCSYIKLGVGGAVSWTVLVEQANTNSSGVYTYEFSADEISKFSADCQLYVQGQDGTLSNVKVIGYKNTISDASSVMEESSSDSESSTVSDSSEDDNIVYTDVRYQLKNNNDTVRFIYIADEEDVMKSRSGQVQVDVLDADGNTLVTSSLPVKSVYKSIYAGGSLITAPSGKIFIISSETSGMSAESIAAQAVFTFSNVSEKHAGKYSNN